MDVQISVCIQPLIQLDAGGHNSGPNLLAGVLVVVEEFGRVTSLFIPFCTRLSPALDRMQLGRFSLSRQEFYGANRLRDFRTIGLPPCVFVGAEIRFRRLTRLPPSLLLIKPKTRVKKLVFFISKVMAYRSTEETLPFLLFNNNTVTPHWP